MNTWTEQDTRASLARTAAACEGPLYPLDADVLDALDDDEPIPYALTERGFQRHTIDWSNIAPHPAAAWMAERCACGLLFAEHEVNTSCPAGKSFPLSPSDQGADREKQPYATPKLTLLGTVAELTGPVGVSLPPHPPGRL